MTAGESRTESRAFEADVAKLLHLMVHSVYSDRDIFLRELISNAADACEKLRYEAIARPGPARRRPQAPHHHRHGPRGQGSLTVEDNGIGMSRDEMVEALGTIARSGTRAFVDKVEAAQSGDGTALIGQFGVGFYSVLHGGRPRRCDLPPGRQRRGLALVLRRQGHLHGLARARGRRARARHPRVAAPDGRGQGLHRARQAASASCASSPATCRCRSHIVEKPGAEPREIADGAALWTKPRAEIKPEEYTDFYRSVAGQFDEPALTIHYRAEGRQEYNVLAFVPGSTRRSTCSTPTARAA